MPSNELNKPLKCDRCGNTEIFCKITFTRTFKNSRGGGLPKHLHKPAMRQSLWVCANEDCGKLLLIEDEHPVHQRR